MVEKNNSKNKEPTQASPEKQENPKTSPSKSPKRGATPKRSPKKSPKKSPSKTASKTSKTTTKSTKKGASPKKISKQDTSTIEPEPTELSKQDTSIIEPEPTELSNQEPSTPKKSSPSKNKSNTDNNNDIQKTSPFKTPEKSTPPPTQKHVSPIVDESPMQKTKNLVDKWEVIKKDNERLAKANKYETDKLEKNKLMAASRNSLTPMSNFRNPETNKKNVAMDGIKLEDHIPEITKKFSMKDKRLRETIKRFNQSYHTANIDLSDNNKEIIVTKPVIKEKRVFREDENDEDKVQRSKRVKVSELDKGERTSLWHKVNSGLHSLKTVKAKKEETVVENDNQANESVIITPTVKDQEVEKPVRLNEITCLNIFNPSSNKSTIPLLLRFRRRGNSEPEELKPFPKLLKSNTKPEWENKLYMVISNESAIPKLFSVPVHWTSLSSQMVYILDISGEALIQFNGSESKNSDKDYAQRICKRISINDNVPDVFEVEQDESYSNDSVQLKLLWKALELDNYKEHERKMIVTKNDKLHLNNILEANKQEIDIEKAIYIYRINEQTSSLDLIHNGSFPTYRCLNSNTSMIFDFVGEVYLWQGKNSSLNARSIGIKFAQKIFSDYKRPPWASLRKINESHEPILFQEKFKDSYLFF